MKKQKVRREKDIRWDIDGKKLNEVIETLQVYLKDYPDATLDFYTYNDYDSTSVDVYVVWYTLETDEEFQKRVAREQTSLEWERKQYEALKKKFEGGT